MLLLLLSLRLPAVCSSNLCRVRNPFFRCCLSALLSCSAACADRQRRAREREWPNERPVDPFDWSASVLPFLLSPCLFCLQRAGLSAGSGGTLQKIYDDLLGILLLDLASCRDWSGLNSRCLATGRGGERKSLGTAGPAVLPQPGPVPLPGLQESLDHLQMQLPPGGFAALLSAPQGPKSQCRRCFHSVLLHLLCWSQPLRRRLAQSSAPSAEFEPRVASSALNVADHWRSRELTPDHLVLMAQ